MSCSVLRPESVLLRVGVKLNLEINFTSEHAKL